VAFLFIEYWVYILQSDSTGRYYVGQTHNLADRLVRHNSGRTAATRGRGPWWLIYREEQPTRQQAVACEREIKAHKSREYLATLVASRPVG